MTHEQTAETPAEELSTPSDWAKLLGAVFYDYDGWKDGKAFDEPISRQEFIDRCRVSGMIHSASSRAFVIELIGDRAS
jgi:hypothetical protein